MVKVFDMIVIARNKVGQKLPTKIFIGRVREVRLKMTIFTCEKMQEKFSILQILKNIYTFILKINVRKTLYFIKSDLTKLPKCYKIIKELKDEQGCSL